MSVVSFPANTTTLLVNTLFTSKIVYLPAISTVNVGSMYYIKDICGNAATFPIYIYPSGANTLENSSATYTIINVNFGAVMVTPDGISNWMILQNYNSNAIAKRWNAAPAAPASLSLTYNPLTTYLTASWTKSGYAATYAVAIYTNSSATTVGATSFQSFPTVTALTLNTTNAISQTYYYATVTATNPLGTSATTTSPFLQVVYLPLVPSAVTAVFSFPLLSCTWSTGTYATSYTIIFYNNVSNSTTGGTAAQIFTGNTGTSQAASVVLVNAYYYYATVTSINSAGNSAIVTSSNTVQTAVSAGPIATVSVSFYFPNSATFPTIVCTWTTSVNANTYTVRYYESVTPVVTGGSLFETDTGVTGLTYSSTTLLVQNNYYYATVTGIGTYGNSATVTSGSYAQAIIYPLSTASVTVSLYFPTYSSTPAITCTWVAVTTAATYTVVFYQNNSASTSGGTTFETNTLQTGTTKNTTTTLVQNKYYYATVVAVNTYGSSSAVLSTSHVQANLTPLTTASVSITFSFPTYSSSPTFTCTWSSVATAATYTIIFYQSITPATTGGTTFETDAGKTGTSFTTTTVPLNTYYYYATVTSVNAYNSSAPVTSASYVQAYMTALPTASVSITFSFPTFSSTPTVTCTWSSVATAATFTVIFYQSASPATTGGTTFETDAGQTGTSITSTTTLVNSNYYYATVTSINSYASSTAVTSSSYVQAYMTALPTASVAISFSFPTYSSTPSFTCTWSAVATAATYTIKFYQTVSAATTGGTLVETNTGKTGTSYTSLTVAPTNLYYYYATVISVNTYAPSVEVTSASSVQAYMTALPTATASMSFSGNSVTCTWSAVATAATYSIVFYSSVTNVTTGGSVLEIVTGITGTSRTSTAALTSGYYYYATVTSVNIYASSVPFTTTNAVQATILPTGGAITLGSGLITTSGSVTLTAAALATGYTVHISTTTSTAQSVYSFTTTTTGSAVAFTPSPSLTGGTTYYAVFVPYNTYGNGQISFSSAVVSGFYTFSGTLTFTPAGATGGSGPTLSQCTTSYSSFGSWVTNTANFNMISQGDQLWTVPSSRNYIITCAGAGNGSSGAIITTTIFLTAGHILKIACGQRFSYYDGAGGSLIYNTTTSTLLIVSGGGGGNGGIASLTTSGNPAGTGGAGGTGGNNGGSGSSSGGSYSGTLGLNASQCQAIPGYQEYSTYSGSFAGGTGGRGFNNGLTGGSVFGGGGSGSGAWSYYFSDYYYTYTFVQGAGGQCASQVYNDFQSGSGGCGRGGCVGTGGGGGYSGGGGANPGGQGQYFTGGGGGSFCSTTITSSSVTNSGNGYISIT
jgi:hypothetical protein